MHQVDGSVTFILHKAAINSYLLHIETQISSKRDMQHMCFEPPMRGFITLASE